MKTSVTVHDTTQGAAAELARRMGVPLAQAAAEIVREEVVALIESGSPSGAAYTDASGQPRRRSAPGDVPARGSGAYVRAWHTDPAELDSLVAESAAANGMRSRGGALGVDLEYGTEDMAPRPHARVAAVRAEARIRELVDGVSAR